MEEENEQLDYDEDELIAARKKAAELQKAIELDGQKLTKTMAGSIADGNSSVPVPSVSIESSTMASAAADKQIQPVDSNPLKVTSTTTEAKATTSTTSAAVGSSGIQQPVVRYHVNPNFNRNKIFQHSNSNMQPSAPYGLVAAGQTSHYYNKHLTMSGTNHSHPPPNHQLHHLHSGQQHIYANGTFPAHQSQQPQLQYNVSTQIPPSSHPPPAPPFTGLPTGNNIYINRSAITDNKNWDLMVDEFVRRNNSARQRRNYSRGRSSTSSSSSSSYSNSRSSSTTSKDSAKSHEKNDRYQGNSKKRDLQQQQKKPHQRERGNPSERKQKISSQTIECAKAIGLDEGYLKKIEEQNRLREEIMRLKTQHRKETAKERTQRQQAKGPTESKAEEAAPPNKRPKVQGPEVAAESKSKGTKSTAKQPANNNSSTASQDATAASKLRPYLAVTVANLKEVRGAQKKVELLAASIGPIKKSWLESANICNVIFEKHEHAKQFILQHHGKMLDKARIDVTLKKVFLNISTIANN